MENPALTEERLRLFAAFPKLEENHAQFFRANRSDTHTPVAGNTAHEPAARLPLRSIGPFVFAGAQDNAVVRFELATGRKTVLTGHRSWIRAFAFQGDASSPRTTTVTLAAMLCVTWDGLPGRFLARPPRNGRPWKAVHEDDAVKKSRPLCVMTSARANSASKGE